jgi:predicted ATPase
MIQESPEQKFIPPGVRDVVRSRLARLSPAEFNLLAAGAVLAQDFDFRQLCQVAGLQENEGLSALDELLNDRLLERVGKPLTRIPGSPLPWVGREGPVDLRAGVRGSSTYQYQFTHDKIRDVVYAEAGDARRQLFHERAFAYLRNLQAAPAQLAHHALIAGLEAEAFHYSLLSGDEAMRVFAVKEAIRHYEQAQISGRRLSVSSNQWEHLFLQLGRAHELNNAWDKARATYQVMRAQAQAMNAPTMETAALNRLATVVLHATFDGDLAISLMHEASRLAELHDNQQGLAETEWNLSHAAIYALDRRAAITHGQRALALARELGQTELIARSLNALVYAKSGLPEHLTAVQAHAEEARALYASLGNRAMEIDCLAAVGWSKLQRGRPQTALVELHQAYIMSQEIENAWGQVNCAFNLASGLMACGQYGQALTIMNAAVACLGVRLASRTLL